MLRRLFFLPPYFLLSILALITQRAAVSPFLPPPPFPTPYPPSHVSARRSRFLSVFASPLFSPSALRRHISTLDGESRDGVEPSALIGILVL